MGGPWGPFLGLFSRPGNGRQKWPPAGPGAEDRVTGAVGPAPPGQPGQGPGPGESVVRCQRGEIDEPLATDALEGDAWLAA